MRRFVFSLICLALVSLRAAPLQAASEEVRQEARERFDRGLRLLDEGDRGGALAEFQHAYELVPHPVVLFNIATVYAATNRAVEAERTLRKLLDDPNALPPKHQERARRLRAEQAARVAELDIRVNVPAAISIAGKPLGRAPLKRPLRVVSGEHVVSVVAPGYAPAHLPVTVAGGQRRRLSVTLKRASGRLASLRIESQLPDAEIVVDGSVVGKTPLAAPLPLAPGRRVIELRRQGYRTERRELTAAPGGQARLELDLKPTGAAASSGLVHLAISEEDAVVFVDGTPRGSTDKPFRLPEGRHRLRVERAGFFPRMRYVTVPRGRTLSLDIDLEPTADTRASYRSRTTTQRTLGWVGVAAGAATMGGSAAFLLVRAKQDRDQTAKVRDLINRLNPDNNDPRCGPSGTSVDACIAERDFALEDLDAIRKREKFGWIGLGAGALLAGTGAFLLLSNDDPDRYEPRPESDVFGRTWMPVVAAGRSGAQLNIMGAF